MEHEKFVYCVLLSKRIEELLVESNNKQMYVHFFAENNKYYDFDNLSMYDIYEIAVITSNNCKDLFDKNYDYYLEIVSFVECCHVFVDEMENLKQ